MKEKIENMPILVFLLIGVAIAGFNYMGSLSTAEIFQTEIATMNTQIQEKKEGLTKAQNASAEIPTMKEEISKLSQTLSKASDFMPATTTPRDILSKISAEAKTAGVRITQTRPEDPEQKNYFEELPMTVEIEGSYSQLTYFMYLVSKQKLIIHPAEMELVTKEIVDGQTSLKLGGKLVGFRYKEGAKQ